MAENGEIKSQGLGYEFLRQAGRISRINANEKKFFDIFI